MVQLTVDLISSYIVLPCKEITVICMMSIYLVRCVAFVYLSSFTSMHGCHERNFEAVQGPDPFQCQAILGEIELQDL